MQPQFHLVPFVFGNVMLAVIVVAIAALCLQLTVLGVQVVGQRATELVPVVRPHTATARYQNALHIGQRDLVAVAQISVGLGPTTSQTFLGMPADVRTHSGINI